MKTTVFIAKNVKIAVEAITDYLQQHEFEVIGTTPDAFEAVTQIKKLKPTIAIIGCELDSGTNLEVIQQLQSMQHETFFVLYTQNGKTSEIFRAYQLGVSGYIHAATTDLNELLLCMQWVLKGSQYLCNTLREKILAKNTPELLAANQLSEREREVLKLVAEEKSNKEIAELLFLSTETVNNHRRNIRQKLHFEGGKSIMMEYAQNLDRYYRLQKLGIQAK
jgi:two-component system, NarL family, nitrate/nitrite response regulator NarL